MVLLLVVGEVLVGARRRKEFVRRVERAEGRVIFVVVVVAYLHRQIGMQLLESLHPALDRDQTSERHYRDSATLLPPPARIQARRIAAVTFHQDHPLPHVVVHPVTRRNRVESPPFRHLSADSMDQLLRMRRRDQLETMRFANRVRSELIRSKKLGCEGSLSSSSLLDSSQETNPSSLSPSPFLSTSTNDDQAVE